MNRTTLPFAVRLSVAGLLLLITVPTAHTQSPARWKIHDMNRPRPEMVTSAAPLPVPAPSDAIVLFDGGDLSKWRSADGSDAKWVVKGEYMESVAGAGYVYTRDSFGDVQLHLEFASPSRVEGNGQGRGNSGVFLMGLYEIQVLDSYDNITYTDGQAAALYGQSPPLVNASRKPGEWQSYDIIFRRPRFHTDGTLNKPARVTVLHNGVLVQDAADSWGPTGWLQHQPYRPHADKLPLSLQDHGNPVRYRNIWVRELAETTRPGPATSDDKPVVTLAADVLDRYTGEYHVDGPLSYFIHKEGEQLYAQIMEIPKLYLITHSTKEFSMRWTAGRFVFDLDSAGVPTGLTFHLGGAEIKAKKVK